MAAVESTSLNVRFAASHGTTSSDVLLVELPSEDFLQKVLSGEEQLSFVGEPDDLAVLCTRSKTFSIQLAETTNSMLLLPASDSFTQRDVGYTKFAYFALTTIGARTRRLRQVLARSEFAGLELEGNPVEDSALVRLTTTDLLGLVQASEVELMRELQAMHCCQIDGFWRRIEPAHMTQIIEWTISEATEHDWMLSALPREPIERALFEAGFHPNAVAVTLDAHSSSSSDSTVLALDGAAIAVRYALQLLATRERFLQADFLSSWESRLPLEFRDLASLTLLRGLAVTTTESLHSYVQRLDRDSLSSEPRERFAQLFAVRPRWPRAELAPYLTDLVCESATLDQLILKYCRSATRPGASDATIDKEYIARHGK